MPTRISRTIHIDAAPPAVWAVITGVERWAEWMDSVRELSRQGRVNIYFRR